MTKVIKWHNSHVKQCLVCVFNNLLKAQQSNTIDCRLSSNNRKNHYNTLGIEPSATQKEIKNAYYELSKTYHPDKNKGDEYASKKFRDVSAAYEVLGNYRTRRLYDKGANVTGTWNQETYDEPEERVVEDDPQTKFYKQHMQRSQAPGTTDSTNFDEWTKQAITRGFQKSQLEKRNIQMHKDDRAEVISNSNTFAYIVLLAIILLMIWLAVSDSNTNHRGSNNSNNTNKTRRST